LARGLGQLVAGAGGVAVLGELLSAFPSSDLKSQISLPIEPAADLDRIDKVERAHPRTRLDQLAALTARRQIIRGDMDRDRFLCAVAQHFFGYFVIDARRGLLETFGARQLEGQRARLESFIEPVAKRAAEQWARRPGVRNLGLSPKFDTKIRVDENLLTLGKKR
jgi:hypothetical protein